MSDSIVTAKGVGGILEVRTGRIVIRRRGLLAAMTHGAKGDKEIRISRIAGIQFKKPGLTNGYIQFSFSGGDESKGGVFSASQDENTVMFKAAQERDFLRAKEEIERQMDAPHGASGPTNPVDQLERLARLRESGALTDEEFTAQKAKILAGG